MVQSKIDAKQKAVTEQIVDFLCENLSPKFIYLFGSFVKGKVRDDSDIDIAFFSEKAISSYEIFMLAQELASLVGREIDLVDLREASTVLRAQIIGTGKPIYSADDYFRAEFAIRALKEYALLNEERQVIIDSIAERGRVYG